MPRRLALTQKNIDKLKPAPQGKRLYIHDTQVTKLQLMVTDTGSKTFYVYQKVNGKPLRVKLGSYPELPPEKARKKALSTLAEIAMGDDPQAQKRRHRAVTVTVMEVYQDYIRARKNLRPQTLRNHQKTLRTALLDWQNTRMTDITPDKVVDYHRYLGENRSPSQANTGMVLLGALFNFAKVQYQDHQGRPLIPYNPVDRLSQLKAWYPVTRRTNRLGHHHLKPWFEAVFVLKQHPLDSSHHIVADYLLNLLFTGMRRGETQQLRPEYIDLEQKILTVPASLTKSGRMLVLPLSPFLVNLFKHRIQQQDTPLIFPGPGKSGHFESLNAQLTFVSQRIQHRFTSHDLRRTFVSIAEQLDIQAYTLKRLLNHSAANDVTAGYIIMDVERLREPVNRIAAYLLNAAGMTDKDVKGA